jgi:N-acetylglucosamine-6-sulfatase
VAGRGFIPGMQMPRTRSPRLAAAAPVIVMTVLGAALVHPGLSAGQGKKPSADGGPACKGTPKECAAEKRLDRRQRAKLRRRNANQERPNVIVVMTDDQDNNMLGMDTTSQLLAGQGTTFQNSYVSYPLCCPSRATFLTGQYAHNHGVIGSDPATGYNALAHSNTLAVWLKRAGYRTGMIGKYLNGYGINDGIPEPLGDARERPPGWSQWFGLTGGSDQRRYQYKLNENGKVKFYGKGGRNYVTDVLGSKTAELIREWAPHPKPFFLWYNPTAPHGESGRPYGSTRDPTPALRHLGRYGVAQAPRTPNFDELDVTDKPDVIRNEPRLNAETIEDIDRRYRGRLESLLAVDEQVGRIVQLLKKAKDMSKTYIIFTSDNGMQMGAHRVVFKAYLYEESTRVPLIVRGPLFPPGAVREQLVSNIDLAPTIVELTGAQPSRLMDGISLVPLANNTAAGVGRDLLFESYVINAFGVRVGKYAYNSYWNGDEELYDLTADPYELRSMHASPGTAALRASLKARLEQLRNCAGASCQ